VTIDLIARVRGEFGEMPGLRLTFGQACRLWQIERVECRAVLQALLAEGFLVCADDGSFLAPSQTHVLRETRARVVA
jgi:hypothetical protein